jgi:tetratricopeptide (TPR) repeat protein
MAVSLGVCVQAQVVAPPPMSPPPPPQYSPIDPRFAPLMRPSEDLALRFGFGFPSGYMHPQSEWLNNEKSFYAKILSASKYDILVVPFQLRGYAFNRATRAAMTAELTDAIARASGARLPDSFLVAKMLGEGQRTLRLDEIFQAANALGAKRIVVGHVGHDRNGKFTIAITLLDRKEATTASSSPFANSFEKDFANIAFDDDHPPIEAYEKLLPEMLLSMGYPASKSGKGNPAVSLDIDKLPSTPKELLTKNPNPVRDAYTYFLFSALTPEYIESTKEGFAAKALLSVTMLPSSSPEYRVLRARAYLGIGHRPAAIRILGTPQTDEEKELLALLNGNLPEVRAIADKQKNPLIKLLMKLDENAIVADYGLHERAAALETVKSLNLPGKIWPYLAMRKLTDHDWWSQFDNLPLKQILDSELPVANFTLENVLSGARVVNDVDKASAATNFLVNEHVKKYVEANSSKTCCVHSQFRVTDFDYLELLAAVGHDNLVRRINFINRVQGRHAAAIEFANTIDTVYRGYPYYALKRAEAEQALSTSTSGVTGEGLERKARENALNALYWEQAQSGIANEAMHTISVLDKYDHVSIGNPYVSDIPFLPGYSPWEFSLQATTKNGLAGILNATSEFYSVSLLVDSSIVQRDATVVESVARELEGRFIGCPEKNELLAELKVADGSTEAAMELYRENIKQSPSHSNSYLRLGILLYESGKPNEASKVFLSFPGFKTNGESNRVAVANSAYEMGSYFVQSGDLDLVKPLFELSSDQKTGARSELSAALKLNLFEGDLDAAVPAMLEAAQRYSDPARFRDYFAALHAMEYSKEAWAGFDAVVGAIDRPEIWESALVGHHRSGSTETQVAAWANQLQYKNAGLVVSYAAEYVARFATTDRTPSKELASTIVSLDRPVWRMESSGETVRPVANGSAETILGPQVERKSEAALSSGIFKNGKKQPVKSDLAYFVQGYRHIKLKEYSQAKLAFDEAAGFYDMTGKRSSYMLPYYAIAAAKAGDVASINKILDRFPVAKQRFDYQLAKAALSSIGGKSANAMQSLTLARYRRPDTYERPLLTNYTFADICEMLFDLTGNTQIRDVAVDWVKARQQIEPWHSWTYAIEAALTTDPVARQRAIAMTYYLDPKSERLSRFKKSEIDAAVAASAGKNIFKDQVKKQAPSRA